MFRSLSQFEICSCVIGIMLEECGLETGLLLCEVEGVRELMGDELASVVALQFVQKGPSKTLSRIMSGIPSLAMSNQDVHELHMNCLVQDNRGAENFSNWSCSCSGSYLKSGSQRSMPPCWYRLPTMGYIPQSSHQFSK